MSLSKQSIPEQELEEQSIENAAKLSPKLVFEVIRRDGEEELERTNRSLFWSGVAAGLMISLSVLGEAIFRTYLPDVPWRFLLENLGYSLGFVVVILGGMQLFTENTITTVLPALNSPSWGILGRVSHLWALVLGANLVGAFCVALLFAHTSAIPAELRPALMELSQHATGMPAMQGFMRAIPAGVIIAAIVWMLPQAEELSLWVIVVFAWLIAAGDFTHVVAGSVEMAYLLVQGELGLGDAVLRFFLPVLAGNIVGGTAIFTLIAWGQVRDDVFPEGRD